MGCRKWKEHEIHGTILILLLATILKLFLMGRCLVLEWPSIVQDIGLKMPCRRASLKCDQALVRDTWTVFRRLL